jgi:hypothetical protein
MPRRGGFLQRANPFGALRQAQGAFPAVGSQWACGQALRVPFREALGVDGAGCAWGTAWAFEQAIGLVWYCRTSHPAFSAFGRRTLERVLRAS